MIANGTSFLGLIASPACVETASKPTYAKKIAAAPETIPPIP
jgi:hypothetical protein